MADNTQSNAEAVEHDSAAFVRFDARLNCNQLRRVVQLVHARYKDMHTQVATLRAENARLAGEVSRSQSVISEQAAIVTIAERVLGIRSIDHEGDREG